MDVLKMYEKLQVKDVHKSLQKTILYGFDWIDRKTVLEARIKTWSDFLEACQILGGIRKFSNWQDIIKEIIKEEKVEEVKKGLYAVEFNIFKWLQIPYKHHSKENSCALVIFDIPFLIYDADYYDFGNASIFFSLGREGNIILKKDLVPYDISLYGVTYV